MSHPLKNRGWIILILGSLSTISPFAIDLYLPAFRDVADSLNTSTGRVPLSISTYFAGLALGQFIYGPLVDRFGRKIPLYVGLIIFAIASALCAASRSIEWLAAMRFVQALGGCAAQVAPMAMVRDFFPVREIARIISLLILILGVSPMLAPTVGGLIAAQLGWRWVFIVLAIVALVNLLVCYWFLPAAHQPDKTVSLHPLPILRNFIEVLKEPQFTTYALSGSFGLAALLVYVTGSPILFMEVFHVSGRAFGFIFAGLSIGFIGSNQINVLLLKKFSSDQIYRAALFVVCPASLLFLGGTLLGWFGLTATLVLLFITLTGVGLSLPNSAALAISAIDRNIGSATAMMGFLQIGVSSLASASLAAFNATSMTPVVLILTIATWAALLVLLLGRRKIPQLKFVEEKGATPIGH